MIPSSFNQIVQTGRLRQAALLAEATRERQAIQATGEETAPAATPPRRRNAVGLTRLLAARDRLVVALGSMLRPRISQP
jgi:hypothetical protein